MGIRLNELVVGDTWAWRTEADGFPAPTWTLTIYLVPRFTTPSVGPIILSSVADDTAHKFAVAASVTSAYTAGMYGYHTVAVSGVQRQTLDRTEWSGEVVLLPNPETLTQGHDARTQAQRALDDIAQAMADAASRAANSGGSTVLEYEIAGRRMRYADAAEAIQALSALEQYWSVKRRQEITAEARRRGFANPWTAYVVTRRA